MRHWPFASYTAVLMVVPIMFSFSAMDGEDEVEIVAVSNSEVEVIAEHDEDVGDVVDTVELTVEGAGAGDCSPTANSTGFPAYLTHVESNNFTCTVMPAGNWSQLVAAPSAVDEYPFLDGYLCLNPFQMVKASQPTLTQTVTAYVSELGDPGGTWYFQVMYRDPGFGFGANLSSMVAVTYGPTN